jgi:hypothetical protein
MAYRYFAHRRRYWHPGHTPRRFHERGGNRADRMVNPWRLQCRVGVIETFLHRADRIIRIHPMLQAQRMFHVWPTPRDMSRASVQVHHLGRRRGERGANSLLNLTAFPWRRFGEARRVQEQNVRDRLSMNPAQNRMRGLPAGDCSKHAHATRLRRLLPRKAAP